MNAATSTTTVDAQIVTITPQIAKELLNANDVNRNVRGRLVEAYAEDMRRGWWRMTGEAIKVSRTGRLLDGQHRLNAIVAADTSIPMMLVTGLDDQGQLLMDQGAARTANDAVRMAGHQNTTFTSSLARWVTVAPQCNPNMEQLLRRKVSTAQILETLRENPDIAMAAGMHAGLRNHLPGSPTAICYAWLMMHRIDSADCKRFYDAFIELSFKALDDPRKAALRRLQVLARDSAARGNKDRAIATVTLLGRAWNAYRKDEGIASLNAYNKHGRVIAPPILK